MASKSHRALYVAPAPSKGVQRWRKAIHTAVAVHRLKSREAEECTREPYKTPQGVAKKSPFRGHEEYVGRVQRTFTEVCHSLLSLAELPYNPYPGFVHRLREISERFHFYQVEERDILTKLNRPVDQTSVPHLCRTPGPSSLYGLDTVLRCVDPQALDKYRLLVEDVLPKLEDLPSSKGHSIQVMTALVGPVVFTGTLYREPRDVQIRQEYLVTGMNVTLAIELFSESVLQNLLKVDSRKHHKVIGVTVPTQIQKDQHNGGLSNSAESSWTDVLWEIDKVHLEKDAFLRSIASATIGNQTVVIECIFQPDLQNPGYVGGQIQSLLNFVELGNVQKPESLTSFTEQPMLTLHEGVFPQKSQAEAYMAAYLPLLLGQRSSGGVVVDKASSVTLKGKGNISNKGTGGVLKEPKSSPRTHVAVRRSVVTEAAKSRSVELDGFRFEAVKADGPFSTQITEPIRSAWRHKWSGRTPQCSLFGSLHYLVLSSVMDRNEHGSDLLVEIGRLLASPAARLYDLSRDSDTLSAVLGAQANNQAAVGRHLEILKQNLTAIFGDELRECSSGETTVYKVIMAHLNTLTNSVDKKEMAHTFAKQLVSELKWMAHLLKAVLVTMCDSLMAPCPILKRCFAEQKKIPEQVRQAETRQRPGKQGKPQSNNKDPMENGTKDVCHGFEDKHIHRHDQWVIRVMECASKDPSPESVNKEAVLLKYMLDVRLDEVWRDFLTELFEGSPLPPNPYPRLISNMRHAALRMDLWFEEDSKLLERILCGVSQPSEGFPFIHHIPGCAAHGSSGIMSVLDPEGFSTVLAVTKDFVPKFYIQVKGLFRVAICTSVRGTCALFGRLLPYLCSVELDEHIYLKGPEGCHTEAVQLSANIVVEQIAEMIAKRDHCVAGVYFGDHGNRWSQDDIKKRPTGFVSEFVSVCLKKQPICLKVYVLKDWRYIPVLKHYKLHWVSEHSPQQFYPSDPVEFYQSVFFKKERSAFYLQNNSSIDADPQSLSNVRAARIQLDCRVAQAVKETHDFYQVQELLCIQDIVTQNTAALVESWRMFHSLAGQVKYVNALNLALQDLVGFALERQTNKPKQMESKSGNKKTDQETKDSITGPLTLSVLNKMGAEFRKKTVAVLKSPVCLCSRALSACVDEKLGKVIQTDAATGNPVVTIDEKTIGRLEEVRNMMDAVGNALSADLSEDLPLTKESVTRILIGPDARSKRILSAKLSQPEAFIRPPMAGSENKRL